jgi:hypothetical protein
VKRNRKVGAKIHTFLTSTFGEEWSASRSGRFTLGESAPGTHCIGGWVGPTAGLDTVEKRKISCPYRESDPGFHGLPARSLVTIPTELFWLLYDTLSTALFI